MELHTYLLALLLLTPRLSRTSDIIPDNFPLRDLSRYTVRYVSESGNDTASCLSNQLYPPDLLSSATLHCGSLVYALTSGHHFRSDDKSNVIVLIFPGSYTMGDRGIEIYDFRNIILSKMPGASGEVVIKCTRMLEDNYNNLFIVRALNFALTGIVFTECGSYSTPVRLQDSSNAIVRDCTFRWEEKKSYQTLWTWKAISKSMSNLAIVNPLLEYRYAQTTLL